MKTAKIILSALSAFVLAAAASAETTHKAPRSSPQDVAIILFGVYDKDDNGALDSAELTQAIEGLQEKRHEVILQRRDALREAGKLSTEAESKGVIFLTLLPEDGAAIVMKDGDVNGNQVLEAEELLATASSFRKLNLGNRGPAANRSNS